MSMETVKTVLLKGGKIVAGLAVVFLVGLLAVQWLSGPSGPVVPDPRDAQAMEAVYYVVESSVPRPPLLTEYEDGALRVALPSSAVDKGPVYYEAIASLCKGFAAENVRLSSIAIMNRNGNSGLVVEDAARLCDSILGEQSLEEQAFYIEASSAARRGGADAPDPMWRSREGRAMFGAPVRARKASAALLDTIRTEIVSPVVRDELALYQPEKISLGMEQLVIVMPRNVITADVLLPVMASLCHAVPGLSSPWEEARISSAVVLNRNYSQGVSFTGDARQCREMASAMLLSDDATGDALYSSMVYCPDDIMECLSLP